MKELNAVVRAWRIIMDFIETTNLVSHIQGAALAEGVGEC
jgi:hypothetical protein